MRLILSFVLFVFVATAISACSDDPLVERLEPTTEAGLPPGGIAALPTTEIRYEGGTIVAEIASTAEQRSRGLSGRESLAEDRGMLFDLGELRVPTFVTRDMNFPLDMVWIDEEKRVVSVEADVEPQPGAPDGDVRHCSPEEPVRYVLEVNGGVAAEAGLAAGTQLSFDLPSGE